MKFFKCLVLLTSACYVLGMPAKSTEEEAVVTKSLHEGDHADGTRSLPLEEHPFRETNEEDEPREVENMPRRFPMEDNHEDLTDDSEREVENMPRRFNDRTKRSGCVCSCPGGKCTCSGCGCSGPSCSRGAIPSPPPPPPLLPSALGKSRCGGCSSCSKGGSCDRPRPMMEVMPMSEESPCKKGGCSTCGGSAMKMGCSSCGSSGTSSGCTSCSKGGACGRTVKEPGVVRTDSGNYITGGGPRHRD